MSLPTGGVATWRCQLCASTLLAGRPAPHGRRGRAHCAGQQPAGQASGADAAAQCGAAQPLRRVCSVVLRGARCQRMQGSWRSAYCIKLMHDACSRSVIPPGASTPDPRLRCIVHTSQWPVILAVCTAGRRACTPSCNSAACPSSPAQGLASWVADLAWSNCWDGRKLLHPSCWEVRPLRDGAVVSAALAGCPAGCPQAAAAGLVEGKRLAPSAAATPLT